ncbi:PREDICTED: uncharacterized protein LOC104738093 [Camelina sativa]|uniref:Uncharacterized protein LOC104738093 n=1 Tax=Camelina sativa TaxID=90675 RepID=A0ABM0VIC7_CAMSA|nr:PREDICTED: uncharacterized protein LOC104738093 [Camelina sativa]
MASQTNSYTAPMSPSSATPPSRRGWWSRPIVTLPAEHDRESTCHEFTVASIPFCSGIFTTLAVVVCIFHFMDNSHCDAKFTIQSIAVYPSSATWHVDFLVKNPRSRYTIYYGDDETAVKLGPLNAAVINTFYYRKSRSHTVFSVDFDAEGNPNGDIFKQLYVKLRAKHIGDHIDDDDAGHVDIRRICYVELFANSVSISNTNASAADWRVGFVARSPVTNCKVSLQTLKSRLLRGDKVMSDSLSQSSGCSGQVLTRDKTNVVFENVVMPEVIDDVIWDFRVDIVSKVNTNVGDVTVFMMATCPDIPVKFTTDPAGKVMGSLHGNMRRCDYIFRCNLGNYLQP